VDILEKERVYQRQMAPIRGGVLAFAAERGLASHRRGRHAHVGVSGPVRDFRGVVDIEMELVSWDRMPAQLDSGSNFTLWCSASAEHRGVRMHASTELFWETAFERLPTVVPLFLERAWSMLATLDRADFVADWPGPSPSPDREPHFGPPRRVRT
jgi:hypothetical protein